MSKRRVPQRIKDNSRVLRRAWTLLNVGPVPMRTVATLVAERLTLRIPLKKKDCWALLHRFVGTPASVQAQPIARHTDEEKAQRAWNGKQHAKQQDVNSDDFLFSFEWRQLRMRVLTKRGARCECCGASPKDGVTVINIDHVKPRRLFPELALVESNLQVLCGPCNHGKGNWDQTDWRKPIETPLQSALVQIERLPDEYFRPLWWPPKARMD